MASRSQSSSPNSISGSGNGTATDPARPDTGEPLCSDSDSDIGLGQLDCGGDCSRLEGEELEDAFQTAADRLGLLVQKASREQLLYLYARYKQVNVALFLRCCAMARALCAFRMLSNVPTM